MTVFFSLFFFHFISLLKHVLGTEKNHLCEMFLLSTHIMFAMEVQVRKLT